MTIRWRVPVVFAAVTLVAAGVAILAAHKIAVLTQLERIVQDIRTATLLPPAPLDPNVIIVAVTEDTLSLFPYRSPVDRDFLAKLLINLDAKKPRAIGLDVLFDQPTEPSKDAMLKETMAHLKTPLFVSYSDNRLNVDPDQLNFLNGFVPPRLRARAGFSVDPVDGTVRWIFPGEVGADGRYVPGLARALAQRADLPRKNPAHR